MPSCNDSPVESSSTVFPALDAQQATDVPSYMSGHFMPQPTGSVLVQEQSYKLWFLYQRAVSLELHRAPTV